MSLHSALYRNNSTDDISADDKVSEEGSQEIRPKTTAPAAPAAKVPLAEVEKDPHQIEGLWFLPKNLWIIVRYKLPRMLTHGSGVDIHKMQLGGKDAAHMASVMQASTQYPSEVEHLFRYVPACLTHIVVTYCIFSVSSKSLPLAQTREYSWVLLSTIILTTSCRFAHGSNDVANAVGPFAAIYYVWSEGVVTPKETPTPVWILAFGGAMIVIGLATYGSYKAVLDCGNSLKRCNPGYNIMSVMGNRVSL